MKRFCDQLGTTLKILYKGNRWANIAGLYIRILKEEVGKNMHASHSPMMLWEYAIERCYLINNKIPCQLFQNNYITPHDVNLGETEDTSNICVYGWCEWTYYCDHVALPENRDKLERVLGLIKIRVIKWLRPYLQEEELYLNTEPCTNFEIQF